MCDICCSMLMYIYVYIYFLENSQQETKRIERNKQKVSTIGSLPLCCSLASAKRKLKKRINLVHSGMWKKSFCYETRWRPPMIRDKTLRLVTLAPELMGLRRQWQTLKSNTFRHRLKNVACTLAVALNTDLQSVTSRLFSLRHFISPFVFHSL